MNTRVENKSVKKKKKEAFVFKAPNAKVVQLAGDFTNWEKNPIALKKTPDGVWQTTIEIEPGKYHYRFLVDGEWQDDRNSPMQPNPFGSNNAIREVV